MEFNIKLFNSGHTTHKCSMPICFRFHTIIPILLIVVVHRRQSLIFHIDPMWIQIDHFPSTLVSVYSRANEAQFDINRFESFLSVFWVVHAFHSVYDRKSRPFRLNGTEATIFRDKEEFVGRLLSIFESVRRQHHEFVVIIIIY